MRRLTARLADLTEADQAAREARREADRRWPMPAAR